MGLFSSAAQWARQEEHQLAAKVHHTENDIENYAKAKAHRIKTAAQAGVQHAETVFRKEEDVLKQEVHKAESAVHHATQNVGHAVTGAVHSVTGGIANVGSGLKKDVEIAAIAGAVLIGLVIYLL